MQLPYRGNAIAHTLVGGGLFDILDLQVMGLGPSRADWQENNSAHLDSTGFAVPLAMQRRQFLEAIRTHTHTPRPRTHHEDPPLQDLSVGKKTPPGGR